MQQRSRIKYSSLVTAELYDKKILILLKFILKFIFANMKIIVYNMKVLSHYDVRKPFSRSSYEYKKEQGNLGISQGC